MSDITRFEEQILLSVWRLGDSAYGPAICDHIKELSKKEIIVSGIYIPLKRLEENGLLEAYQGDSTSVRGGQSKRIYRLTQAGLEVLLRTLDIQKSFWQNLPDLDYL
jgi:DNA-binding PadR family transcriptional regulator